MEDVSRDAGDIAACLELNLVRTIGDALVAHVEGCIFGKVEARFLRRGVGVLECLVWADLKIDGVLGGPRLGVGDDAPGLLGGNLHVGNVDAIGRKIVDGGCILGRALKRAIGLGDKWDDGRGFELDVVDLGPDSHVGGSSASLRQGGGRRGTH